MSFDALSWAAKQRPGNLAAKMALLALANYANEAGHAYPSTAAIADFGDMNHKTATAALDRLEELNLISDSGKRAGRSGQIKVYQLHLESLPKQEASQNRKPPVLGNKDTQKRVTDTIKEPVIPSEAKASSGKRTRKKKPQPFVLPDDIPAESWAGFEEMRRRINKPMTDRARQLAVAELRKIEAEHGQPPGAVLDNATLLSWQGIYPIKDHQHGRLPNDRRPSAERRNPAFDMYAEAEAEARALYGGEGDDSGPFEALPAPQQYQS